MKYLLPLLKLSIGTTLFLIFISITIAAMLEGYYQNLGSIIIALILAFLSYKLMMSGWRSYKQLTGPFNVKKNFDLELKKAKAKQELISEELKFKRNKLKQEISDFDALREDCERFGIKVGFMEILLQKANKETVDSLKLARQEEEKISKEKNEKEKQKIEREKQRKEKERIEKERRQKERRERDIKKMQSLIDKYEDSIDVEVISNLRKKKPCIDMPMEMVDYILGKKYETKEAASSSARALRCKYGRGEKNQRGNYTYRYEVVFKNDILTSFKQL